MVAVPASLEYSGNIDLKKETMEALRQHYPNIKYSLAQEGMYQFDDKGYAATDLAWR
jgi:hypothetical protein